MPHVIREQRIRQRLNCFRKAEELESVTDAGAPTLAPAPGGDGRERVFPMHDNSATPQSPPL